MQTPKTKTNSFGVPQRTSPQSTSSEVSQKISSPKGVSPEASQKTSSRVVRQLKPTARYSEHTVSSSNLAGRASKERSPKVVDQKSPQSPVLEGKRPGKLSDLESLISKLENDLKTVKDQLCFTEALKRQARKEAEESNEHLVAVSSKLEESHNQLLEQSASEEVEKIVIREAFEGRNQALQSDLQAIQKQHSQDLFALFSALNEIKKLKTQLKIAAESEAKQTEHSESAQNDLHMLKENLRETLLVVQDMKNQLRDAKESEAQAREVAGETFIQLETAKKMVETLRSDEFKTKEAYDAIASELDLSCARVKDLEELINKLKADMDTVQTGEESMKVEVEQLKLALEAAEIRCNDVQVRSRARAKDSHEMVEQTKSSSGEREAKLEMELRKSRYEIEELKANLMDKETELQGICEENEGLAIKLENTLSGKKEQELEQELRKSNTNVETLKARLINKEIECENVMEENEKLKMEMKKISNGRVSGEIVLDQEAPAGNTEREALMKIGHMTEEIDKSNRKAARVTVQLEAAQAANTEMETELRRLKVQSDQWRKAAEAAAAMLSTGNNEQFVERTGSMDSHYSPRRGMVSSPYAAADLEDELLKKNNATLLKRFGVLWKKQQK